MCGSGGERSTSQSIQTSGSVDEGSRGGGWGEWGLVVGPFQGDVVWRERGPRVKILQNLKQGV